MLLRSFIEPQSKRLVILHDEAIRLIQDYRQLNSRDDEAGGVLIGSQRGSHFEVTVATPPQPGDKRSRYSFKRNPDGHQQIITQRWSSSGKVESYLGEWHTHPEPHPTPSGIDLREWRKLSAAHADPLLVIIGGQSTIYIALLLKDGVFPLRDLNG